MSLKDEIKQDKQISSYEKGVVNILLSYYFVENKLTDFLGRFHITLHQYNILRILRGRHPESYTNNEIKERMLHKEADATRLVNRLARKGLVTRERSETDRRKVKITVVNKGLHLLEKVDQKMNEVEDILVNLNHNEISELNRLLEKMREQ